MELVRIVHVHEEELPAIGTVLGRRVCRIRPGSRSVTPRLVHVVAGSDRVPIIGVRITNKKLPVNPFPSTTVRIPQLGAPAQRREWSAGGHQGVAARPRDVEQCIWPPIGEV